MAAEVKEVKKRNRVNLAQECKLVNRADVKRASVARGPREGTPQPGTQELILKCNGLKAGQGLFFSNRAEDGEKATSRNRLRVSQFRGNYKDKLPEGICVRTVEGGIWLGIE